MISKEGKKMVRRFVKYLWKKNNRKIDNYGTWKKHGKFKNVNPKDKGKTWL